MPSYGFGEYVLVLTGMAILSCVAIAMVRREVHRRWPGFFLYVVFHIVQPILDIIGVIQKWNPVTYYYFFYAVESLSLALSFVVIYEVAIGLAYFTGMTTAFVLARMFVFEAEAGDTKGQYVRFALVNVVAFIQVWCISVGLARLVFPAMGLTWQAETIAHVIGVVSPVVTSYLAHKRFSFRSKI